MPIADPPTYRAMLQQAAADGYAIPSINVTSSTTANAVMAGLAEAGSDGIVGVSLGGARFAAGSSGDPALGALAHMFDGSHLPLADNLRQSAELLSSLTPLGIMLELEIGLVGGEEDGIDNRGVDAAKLYSSPADMVAVVDALGADAAHQYLVAASFGNVHGVHPPGDVVLDPEVLRRGQLAVTHTHGARSRLLLVFHGGSGSSQQEIDRAISYGVVKMNVDTDTQYAYTEAVADHILAVPDRVLGTTSTIADKSAFEQRAWMALGEAAMAAKVRDVCKQLGSSGRSLRS